MEVEPKSTSLLSRRYNQSQTFFHFLENDLINNPLWIRKETDREYKRKWANSLSPVEMITSYAINQVECLSATTTLLIFQTAAARAWLVPAPLTG
jgi:hypothetical protein